MKRHIKKALFRIKHLPFNKNLFLYSGNKFKHFYFKSAKSTKVAYPSTIMLELGNHCNLHCTTCPREYDYGKKMDKGYMKLEEAKKIVDEIYPYLDSIGLTGMGETFLYKDLEEIVDYIKNKNKGIIISLSTNAMLPNFIKQTERIINKVDTIQISIDGLNDIYESIRVNAKFDVLDRNIDELMKLAKNSHTDIMFNMVVTKENYFQMADVIKYAHGKNIRFVNFNSFNLACVTNIDIDYYSFYQSREFLEALENMNKTKIQYPDIEVTNWKFSSNGSFQKCPFPWGHFYVTWDGYVVPCCSKPFPKELNFGNVFEHDVISILNSESFREFRKKWFAAKAPLFCDKCHFLHI